MSYPDKCRLLCRKFNKLVKTKLTKESSITFYGNSTGHINFSYIVEPKYNWLLNFNNLDEGIKLLDNIARCDSISELLDYLDQ